MNALKKRLIAVTLAVVLTIYPVNALAAPDPVDYYQNSAQAYEAAYYMMSLMELILDEYMGSDIGIEELYFGALAGISDVLDDYSEYMTLENFSEFVSDLDSTGFLYGIGIYVNEQGSMEVSTVLSGSSAEENGLLPGDFILSINGKATDGMTSSEAVGVMNENGATTAELEMMRGTVAYTVTVVKKEVKNDTLNVLRFDEIYSNPEGDHSKIRYVHISAVGEETHHEMEEAIAQMKAEGVEKIILDLRDNSGGYLEIAVEICQQIVPKGPILYKAAKNGTLIAMSSDLDSVPFEEIIVLTNANTASAAEIIASALQDSGSQVVGQTSYGKGVIQTIYDMPDGGVFKLTTGEYYRRSGDKLNLIGISPDVYIDLPTYIRAQEVSPDMINVKKLLTFLGYYSGEHDDAYDDIAKAAVVSFKKANGLEENDLLDMDTVLHMNEALYNAYKEKDVVLEAAYEMIID